MCAQWDETAGVQGSLCNHHVAWSSPSPSHIFSVPTYIFFILFPLLAMNLRFLSSLPTHHHSHTASELGAAFFHINYYFFPTTTFDFLCV